ncbi:MAG: dihydrofolate reductase [Alphaproteobacteria bacterium]
MVKKPVQKKISLVVAYTNLDGKKIIGDKHGLLWHLPEDLKNFKKLTIGRTVVMGRKTWDSLPKKPLADRRNVVISRQKNLSLPDGVWLYDDLEKFLQGCDGEIAIIGGAEIFHLAEPLIDIIYATEISSANHFKRQAIDPCYFDIDIKKNFDFITKTNFSKATIPFVVREYHQKKISTPATLQKLLAA